MHAAGPDPWPGGCECRGGDRMNALASNDLEAAGLLALVRPDDDGAPGRQGSNGRPGEACRAGAAVAPEVTDGTGLARARQRFLAAQPLEPGQVRDTILASWQRSRRWNVAAGHIDPCYVRDPGPGTPLTRSALPVLQSLLGEGLESRP